MPGTGAAASYGDLLITSLVVLVGVCIAAFVAVKVLGRFLATGRVRGAHLLDVVARVPLEPRRALYVVEVAGKTLLVGTSEMGLSVLSELDGDEVRARTVVQPTFGELVRGAWARRRGRRDGDAPASAPQGLTAAEDVGPSRSATSAAGERDLAIDAAGALVSRRDKRSTAPVSGGSTGAAGAGAAGAGAAGAGAAGEGAAGEGAAGADAAGAGAAGAGAAARDDREGA